MDEGQMNYPPVINPEKKTDSFKIFLVIVVILLLISNGYTLYRLLNVKTSNEPTNNANQVSNQITNQISNDATIDNNKLSEIWYGWPSTATSIFDLFDRATIQQALNDSPGFNTTFMGDRPMTPEEYGDQMKAYKVGKVDGGQYQGQEIYVIALDPVGPISKTEVYKIIKNNSSVILLGKYSISPQGVAKALFKNIDNNITIDGLIGPATISIPNSKFSFSSDANDSFKLASVYENPRTILQTDNTYVYQDGRDFTAGGSCFFIKVADGTVENYYLNVDFRGSEVKNNLDEKTSEIINVTWNDGTKNTEEYRYKDIFAYTDTNGCLTYAGFITSTSKLNVAGHTPSGDSIYELADLNIKEDPTDNISVLQRMYDGYYVDPPQKKMSFAQFVANKPLLFWQDPFGHFVKIVRAEYAPMVEMAKPVIYLYPEKTGDISVKVSPTGGLSYTEPAYNKDWHVQASPDSQIYNYDDQKTYPYLFWEGRGLNYQKPNKGFVVAKDKVEELLQEKLLLQGLNKTEAADFINFWAPKMKEKNYYFISFIDQKQFDWLAPLNINPQPDTVIRVFMDYTGLDEYQNVLPQSFHTPTRQGFTIVEWGGAINK